MQSGNRTAIIIITYNNSKLLRKQIERIERHCKDQYEIVIVDNSTNKQEAQAIKYICSINKCIHLKTDASSKNGSGSHAFAANVSWITYRKNYDYFFYLDHDCFPIKDFSVENILSDKIMAGIGQEKSKTYLWPGCLMFKAGLDIDFSTNHEHQLDTGGNLYKIIEQAPDDIIYFDEVHKENPEFTKNMYNFYSLIMDGTFMHFINGSGWNKVGNQDERINSLLNQLDKF
jgi:glycosyltransferase involved in cell wall biosynthesis